MILKFFMRIILCFWILLSFSFSSFACDGLDVTLVSNLDLGNGTYQVTIQYCEEVSNGGTSSVWGIIVDVPGANILSTSTPSFTSSSTGTTINYNVIDNNTVQWGEWDNNPSVPIFMDDGDPEECFTIVIIVDALITSVNVAGSSAPVDEGNGFVNWNGRYTCKTTESVPPPPCTPVPPTFNPIGPVCQNASVVLPTTSTNGQTGTWAPVVNTSNVGTINYTFTPSGGGCITSAVLPITVTGSITPTFNPIASVCVGAAAPVLPTTSTNGITGTWSPATVSTATAGTTTYTFTPSSGACNTTATLNVTISAPTTPTFSAQPAVCVGTAVVFPTTSTNGITGTWAPAVSTATTGTTTYTFTPNAGQCATTTTRNLTVNALTTPTFNPIPNICQNSVAPALPATSTNGITGNWAPATISTATVGTQTYTFTPNAGQCANTTTLNVTIFTSTTPTFNAFPDQCQNAIAPALPATSTNGITGTWAPAIVNTSTIGTQTYTFTPNAGQCASTNTLNVTVLNSVIPNFNPLPSVCQNEVVVLPTTSTNGITGTWSPAVNTSTAGTTIYTFNSTSGSCPSTNTLSLTVIDIITPTFNPIASVCVGAAAPVLPTTSTNGITGTWSGAVSTATAGTFNFTFTPTPPTCNTIAQISVTINPLPNVNAGVDQTICAGDPVTLNGSGATNYVWNNGVTDAVAFTPPSTATYTVTGTDANGCQNTDDVDVIVVPLPIVDAGVDQAICIGASVNLTAAGATSYVWNNGGANGQSVSPMNTTTYTVTGTIGSCTNSDDVTITVNPLPVVAFTPDVTTGCEPLDVNFTVQSPPGVSCVWNFGDGTTDTGCGSITHTYNGASGCFDVSMTTTDANGCVNSQMYPNLICLVAYPIAEFGVNPSVITTTNSVATMLNESQGAVSYFWDFGDDSATSNATDPIHTFPFGEGNSYTIMLVADNGYGCTDTAYQTIKVEEDIIFYVPNTFTPDGDSFNQTFKPIFTSGFDPYDYTLWIYNRWGEVVFESHNSEIGWDGKYAGSYDVQDGTYTWKIEFKQSMNDKRRTEIGHVTIIR